MTLSRYSAQLRLKKSLSSEEACLAAEALLSGHIPTSSICEFLSALAKKGETADEIVGFVQAMRKVMLPIYLSEDCFDCCGTGGSGKSRFNISTAAAFVLACLGKKVAKHGNRGSSDANGSFDFLESLGIRIDLSPSQSEALFKQTGLCFLFARTYHPAVKNVADARRQLGHKSIFNLIGPLCNPASPGRQLIGTSDIKNAQKISESLLKLDTKQSFVIAGDDGSDECSTQATSHIFSISEHHSSTQIFDPKTLKYVFSTPEYPGGSGKQNAEYFLMLLEQGNVKSQISQAICLNAAWGLHALDPSTSINDNYLQAIAVFKNKNLIQFIDDFRKTQAEL